MNSSQKGSLRSYSILCPDVYPTLTYPLLPSFLSLPNLSSLCPTVSTPKKGEPIRTLLVHW